MEEESVDSPVFDDAILGLSLGVSARLQMKSPANATTVSLVLAPRSVYMLKRVCPPGVAAPRRAHLLRDPVLDDVSHSFS